MPSWRLAVLVGIEGQADLFRRRDHHLQQRHLVARRVGDAQQAVAAAELVRAAVVALHPLEDRQHVLVAPAAVAELRPVIVVLRLAADIDHAVDRARAAQHLAARNLDAPPARAFVRLRRVAPVDGRIVDHLGDADRHARPEEVRALGARLQQQHPVGAALASAGWRPPRPPNRHRRRCSHRWRRSTSLSVPFPWEAEEDQRPRMMARDWPVVARALPHRGMCRGCFRRCSGGATFDLR